MSNPLTYKAFGLVIQSDFELDTLDRVPVPTDLVDVTICRASGIIRDHTPQSDPWFEFTPQTQYMYWRAIGGYLIADNATVFVEPHPDTSDHLVSQALLGLVVSVVLERRGVLCLHAGALEIYGQAAVLLGDKGSGKSTSSAALMNAGYRPITDDLVAVDVSSKPTEASMIRPGFSSLKLWPDSVAALKLPSCSQDRLVHPHTTKVQKRMPLAMAQRDTGFGAAFVLCRSAETRMPTARRLAPHEALQNLLRHSFMARYGETQLGQDHLVLHMKRCSSLVAQVPVYMLNYPDDLTALSALVGAIEDIMCAIPDMKHGAALST